MKSQPLALLLLLICSLQAVSQQLETGQYYIKVNATGKYLSIDNMSQDNQARLVQWDFTSKPNQQFTVRRMSDMRLGVYYLIQPVHSGKYLSTEGKTERGAKIIQFDWVNQDNQRWYLDSYKNGWQIKSVEKQSRIYLSGYGASTYTPENGSYFFINNDALPMYFEFKKDEIGKDSDRFKAKRVTF
ncbi:RICIN domain-containing protein [Xanthocytophaga flava]|uniref:RICIN domain-containing protein n=1 Tax=Xanthocytophaga flava TaxID=3048013 RepID=UPI0028D2DAFA|nr:RICIN domain-containing protein [Xanthocytophaga flavus]MDJ1470792.1 RICIN domain-containing protein [Xanthocytophaga flavus]